MPDALGYQKINTLDTVEDMPSFLEKQVKSAETIQAKKVKQQSDDKQRITDFLQSAPQDGFIFQDYYQKKFAEGRNKIVDKFMQHQNDPYTVLNDPETMAWKMEMMHDAEVGKAAQKDFDNTKQEIYKLKLPPDVEKQRIDALSGIINTVKNSDDPIKAWSDPNTTGQMAKLTTPIDKPFEEIKALNQIKTLLPKPTPTGEKDENGNTIYQRDPNSISQAASAYQQNDQAYQHYAKIFKDIPNQKDYMDMAIANSKAGLDVTTDPTTGVQQPDPIKAFIRDRVNKEFGGTSIDNPDKIIAFNSVDEARKATIKQRDIQLGINQQNADTLANKQTGVTITKDNYGNFTGVKGNAFDYNIDANNPNMIHVRPHSFTDETKYTYTYKDGKDVKYVSGWVTGWNKATGELTIKTYDKSKWGTSEESKIVPATSENMNQFASQGGDDHAKFIKNTTPAAGGNDNGDDDLANFAKSLGGSTRKTH